MEIKFPANVIFPQYGQEVLDMGAGFSVTRLNSSHVCVCILVFEKRLAGGQ